MSAPGDVRSFYAALGIHLPGWAHRNGAVRCFANPSAHAHDDRTPSCSVSVEHGAWRCWACGARGGPYDAALACGHTPASAIDLMVQHGLTERRSRSATHRQPRLHATPQPVSSPPRRRDLPVSEADVRAWHEWLFSEEGRWWRWMLAAQRLWSPSVMRELELGHDHSRITIPIRNATGQLRGLLRYRPAAPAHKMLAVPGTRLGLIPHPAHEPSRRVMLLEGPPDMIAARSRGWPAIAVPGDHAWQPQWAELLNGRAVTIVMDCDRAGRDAAKRIAGDLERVASVRIVDLAPARNDGFDLTDWLLTQQGQRRAKCTPSSSSRRTITR